MPQSPRILVITDLVDRIRPIIRSAFPDLEILYIDEADAVAEALHSHRPEIVFAYPGEPFPKSRFGEIMSTSSVRWVANSGAGTEHFGVWDTSEITVTNAAGVNCRYLADYTISAHMIANIRIPHYIRQQRQKIWQREEWRPFQDRRFCIVGLGHIGRAVAERAKALGLYVSGTRGTARPTDHVDEVYGADGLLEALKDAEFVSVHTASTPDTKGLIDDAAFAAMSDGVIFLNASRGPVVEDEALLKALDSGKVHTAILDVFDVEPLPEDHPFWTHPNVIVTPHIADSIAGWQENNARSFCKNLSRWIAGEMLQNIVDPHKGY